MNTKKKGLLTIICSFILAALTAVTVMAETSFGDDSRLMDTEGLLTADESESILEELNTISEKQKLDVVIATVPNLNGEDVQTYTDQLYEEADFGYGEDRDGVMLLLSMEERDWCISTHGYGITAFTDAGIEYIREKMGDALSSGAYADAFHIYAEQCDAFITQARNGEPFDSSNLPKDPLSLIWLPISLAVGFVLSCIIVGGMEREMKSVRSQEAAENYVKAGSMHVTNSRDLFLYKKVNRVKKEKKEEKSGSSTHQSSSGETHGGSSGKF